MNAGRGEGEGCVAGHAHRDVPDRLVPDGPNIWTLSAVPLGVPWRVTAIDETGPEVVTGKGNMFIVVPLAVDATVTVPPGGVFRDTERVVVGVPGDREGVGCGVVGDRYVAAAQKRAVLQAFQGRQHVASTSFAGLPGAVIVAGELTKTGALREEA